MHRKPSHRSIARSTILAAVTLAAFAATRPSVAQPIDPTMATGTFTGGGITLTADDLRRFAKEHAAHRTAVAAESGASTGNPEPANGGAPRGGGIGNVLIVECNGLFGYDTIQGAIDAAVDGDVVVVLPFDCSLDGRWVENIDFLGKAIRVQSANPNDPAVVEATVIDGEAFWTFLLVSNESVDSVISGLSITSDIGAIRTEAGVRITNCVIRDTLSGSGVSLLGNHRTEIEDCEFINNNGSSGAAIFGSGQTHPAIKRCRFFGNSAPSGAVVVLDGNNIECGTNTPGMCPIIEDCEFESNTNGSMIEADYIEVISSEFRINSSQGSSASCINALNAIISYCIFEENTIGAIEVRHLELRDSVIRANSVGYNRVVNAQSTAAISDCLFESNQTSSSGGALRIAFVRPLVERCTFLNNIAGGWGGAIFVETSTTSPDRYAIIRDCIFFNNTAGLSGGAIKGVGTNIDNCLIVGNRAMDNGGGTYWTHGIISNCTIVGNHAENVGAGTFHGSITNSIIYNNRDSNGDGHGSQTPQGTVATFSNIQNLQYTFTPGGISNEEAGNFDAPPMFVDPGSWNDGGTPDDYTDDVFAPGDYHLLPDSPCIDAGDPNFAPDDGATDIDGEPRVMGCRMDIGADEFPQDEITLGDFDGDGAVTVADIPLFVQSTLGFIESGACIGDVNGDGRNDGRDVSDLVALLIAG